MSVLNVDEARAWKPWLQTPTQGHIREVLSGTYVVKPDGPAMLFFSGGGVTRQVRLPPILPQAGQKYFIANLDSVGSLTVVTNDGIAVALIGVLETIIVVSHHEGWMVLSGRVPATQWTRHVVTTDVFEIPETASEVLMNWSGPGLVTVVLPRNFDWNLFHPRPNSYLMVYDVSGNAVANNIRIVAREADTIGSGIERIINTNFGGYTFRRTIPELWVTV